MSKVEKFEDLNVWKDAVKIGVEIYKVTSRGTLSKDYSTKDQIRRSAVSISNNIAEGFEYNNNLSFIRFLKYSKGSAGELRSNLLILKEAELLDDDDYQRLKEQLIRVSRSIEALIRYLKNFENEKRE
jgi:four helix bundle protein